MKKIYWILFIASSFSMLQVSAQEKTIDSLVHRAFSSIKNVDEQAYLKLFPTYPQIKAFFNGLVNSVSDSMQKAAMTRAFSMIDEETYNSEIKSKMVKSFQEFISNGRVKGIDWTRARLDSFTSTEDEHDIEMKSVHGNLYFSEQGKNYVVPFTDVIWMKEEQGWFGFEMKRILKKGEEVEVDGIKVKDVTISDTAWVEDAPPPEIEKPASKKPSDKKPVTKKPEAKQPAKKPSTTTKPKTKS